MSLIEEREMPAKINMEGIRIGKLLCIDNGLPHVLCKCDCGNTKHVNRTALLNKVTNSCGCLLKEKVSRGKLILGCGIDDSNYQTQSSTGKCPYFNIWKAVLNRSMVEKTKIKQPCYKGVTVCTEWLTFSNFKAWMETQDWEGKDLDKDLLSENKEYSPENCMFIPAELNSFLTTVCNRYKGINFQPRNLKKKYAVRVTDKYTGEITRNTFISENDALDFKIEILRKNFLYFKEKYGDYIFVKLNEKLNRLLTQWGECNESSN